MIVNEFQHQIINQAFVCIANGVNLFKSDRILGLRNFSTGIILILQNIPDYKPIVSLEKLIENENLINNKKNPTVTIDELQQELNNLKTIINMRSIEKIKMRRSIDEKRNCVWDDVW